jgi:uncharacterized protein YifN (PemK superfamily)
MTTKPKEDAIEYYHHINGSMYGLNKDSYCMLDQIQIMSKKRLIRKLNDIENRSQEYIPLYNNIDFLEIVKKIKNFI